MSPVISGFSLVTDSPSGNQLPVTQLSVSAGSSELVLTFKGMDTTFDSPVEPTPGTLRLLFGELATSRSVQLASLSVVSTSSVSGPLDDCVCVLGLLGLSLCCPALAFATLL